MSKTSDLDAFDRGQIVGARRMGHSISEIVRELGFSRSTVSRVYREYTDGGGKTRDRANCKGQLALNKCGVRRLSRIVHSQRSQTLAQITTQPNQGASRTVSKRTVQRSLHHMVFGSRRPTRVGTVQGHGDSIMVWGVFSWLSLGSLALVPICLNVIRYVELLGDHLHPFMLYCHPHGNGVFQQDNCTFHRSRLATA
ncbi:hypothetical protein AVEN_104863-1 [Araneus ventricosus]|uniref:Tc3 transposase DNA binding domain-containing protein n=1 Tax=Araneus ventricosus TaxID=182803 RepID=A0A4Y2IR04_ARAVE|nr:hypothetical protein AVEN_104863-1 [Araneus ventricosus]